MPVTQFQEMEGVIDMIKNPLLRKERRVFEEALRKNLLLLESRGWDDEAQDLLDRLTIKMVEKMAWYTRLNENLEEDGPTE